MVESIHTETVRERLSRPDLAESLGSAAQWLEEHHVVAWARNLAARERFGLEMAWYLRRMAQTQTVVLNGTVIRDLDSFCSQLEGQLPGHGRLGRSVDGVNGVVARLRQRTGEGRGEGTDAGAAGIVKRRFYIWRDADVLLRNDARLFGRLVDALTGVAAEAEYASEDRLLIHRAVFVGGPALDVYAEDGAGQFQRWLAERGERPLWSVISGLASPPVMRLAVG
jgi:hypothetical protein